MFIYWLGHSCMKICNRKYSMVFDPFYPGYVPGVPDIKAKASRVLCSHDHQDHNWAEGIEIMEPKGEAFKVTEINSVHDDKGGKLRGSNTIHIVEADGLRIVHMGDQGAMLTDEEFELLGTPDVLMIPVGGYYTVDAKTAKAIADRCKAKVIIPMHYRGEGFGYDIIAPVDDFTGLYPPETVRFYDTDTLEVTENTEPQVAVLKFKK